nr:hypothetical protein [Candidatus Woesearchaeota archaeon]
MAMEKSRKYSPVIFSSEIAQYCFCKAAWWQGRMGNKVETEGMRAGTEFHKEYGSRVGISRILRVVRALLVGTLVLVVIGAVMRLWSG